MIKKGHKSEEVKDVQRKLRQAGFLKFPTDTGFVGGLTDKAIREYQKSRGIKVDGIVGDRTKDMLDNEMIVRKFMQNPNIQGAPQQTILKDMYRNGHHGINLLAKGQAITPDDLAYRKKELEDNLKPYYPRQ
jgi:peptidoglycan hydrolase-like protein with peptidoglycan-binding domain